MANVYIQTSGYFDKLDPLIRYEAREEFFSLLKRHTHQFRELILNAHLKRLRSALGSQPLLTVNINLFTEQGKFHVEEEGYGAQAAIRNAVIALRYQIERFVEMQADLKTKAPSRATLES